MFSNSQYFEWKFWCIPLGTTQNLFELVFLFLQKEAFAPTIIFPDVHDQEIDFRRKSGFPIFFPQQRSFCSVLPSQEIKSLPRHCRNNNLFQQSLHLLLRDTIRTKFTLQFCLFHTYGDVYAPLITFMGTWIWERECLLSLSFLFRTLTRTLYIENEGQISTQRFSISNREVVQITARFGVQLIRNCTATTIALNPVICTLGTIAMSIWRQVHTGEQWKHVMASTAHWRQIETTAKHHKHGDNRAMFSGYLAPD